MIINTSRIEHVLTNKAIPAYMLEIESNCEITKTIN